MQQQLDLFAPTYRNTDPVTSQQAGESVKVRAGSQQWLLLVEYSKHPLLGLTDEEAGRNTGLDKLPRCCYWKRCSELRAFGLIETGESTRVSTAHQNQQVCFITELGRMVLAGGG